jgi:hypothetical protein
VDGLFALTSFFICVLEDKDSDFSEKVLEGSIFYFEQGKNAVARKRILCLILHFQTKNKINNGRK